MRLGRTEQEGAATVRSEAEAVELIGEAKRPNMVLRRKWVSSRNCLVRSKSKQA